MKRIFVLSLALLSSACYASDYEKDLCRNGLFPSWDGEFSQAKIKSDNGKPVHFYRDDQGGPMSGESCATKPYLVDGDSVLIAQEEKGWSCVWYTGKKREFVGWMPSSSLQKQLLANAVTGNWLGTWKAVLGDNEIVIRVQQNGELAVTGNAYWYGGKTDDGYQNVHVGDLEFQGRAQGNTLAWGDKKDDWECAGVMQLVNGSLIVRDNGNCGGMNVRFNNVYRKTASGI